MSESTATFAARNRIFVGGIGISAALILLLGLTLILLFRNGVGLWNNNIPVTWALDIVSYDWWIGIACGGLLVAAVHALTGTGRPGAQQILGLTLAVFGAASAAIYPIIHLGRPWFFFWNLPYPNSFGLWPQVRSPLFWDAIDILGFLAICIPFWYFTLLPTLARLRDQAFHEAQEKTGQGMLAAQLYGIAALGWRGAAAHWSRWMQAQRIFGVLAILMVIVLQTGAAVMFSGTLEPGWHDNLLPLEYVFEAGLGGAAMLCLLSLIAWVYGNTKATERDFTKLAWAMLGFGICASLCFAISQFKAAYGGEPTEHAALLRRMYGPHAWSFWVFIMAGLLSVHLLWLPGVRRSPFFMALLGAVVVTGLWAGHFMLIVANLQRDYLPVGARPYHIGFWEWSTFGGTAGLFTMLFLLFLRFVPLNASGMPDTRRATHYNAHTPIWGIGAAFSSAAVARAAWRELEHVGIGRLDAYSPMPLHTHIGRWPMLGLALGGGVFGGIAMFLFCAHATDYAYVFDIGSRPVFNWTSYIVPSCASAVACSSLATALALLALNRLPRLNHPAFNMHGIGRASFDRFFVVLSHLSGEADEEAAERALKRLAHTPLAIHRVPR